MRLRCAATWLAVAYALVPVACGSSDDPASPNPPGDAPSAGANSNSNENDVGDSDGNSNASNTANENSNQTSNGNKNANNNGNTDPVEEPRSSTAPLVTLNGREVVVDGKPFSIKGVCWSPVPKGRGVDGIDFAGAVDQDAPMLAEAGINLVRTYSPITDTAVLDTLWENGIYVAMTVFNVTSETNATITSYVDAVKDHPAVLLWLVGNEWNYNLLYGSAGSISETVKALQRASAHIQTLDDRPVATVYGSLPSVSTITDLPDVDIWGLNVYSSISFFSLFTDWESRSSKPMFLAEYGADAYNAISGMVDVDSQAEATRALTLEIINADVRNGGVAFGGTIFEWNDEWWKAPGSNSVQDAGGIAPGGGPYPDNTFNEEFWGIVDIDRNPRPAYFRLQELYLNRVANSGFEAVTNDAPDAWLSFGAAFNPFEAIEYTEYSIQADGANIGPSSQSFVGFGGSQALKTVGRRYEDAGSVVRTLATVFQQFSSIPAGADLLLSGHFQITSIDPPTAEERAYLVIKCFNADFSQELCGAGGARSMFVTNLSAMDAWQELSVSVSDLPASVVVVQAGVEFEQCLSGTCQSADVGGSVYWDDLVFTWEQL
ncbi:MAG: glycoside hydrolase family 2 TIM barrel-domain containing protein [Myxococcota bacterium]